MAGWPDDEPVWTGSCPCQPYSIAGLGRGAGDERHLWPTWLNLIEKFRPIRLLGEQVEKAIGYGWLDTVQDDLEELGYTFGAACLPAAGVGAPHTRQRVWFVADAGSDRLQGRLPGWKGQEWEVEHGPLGCGRAIGRAWSDVEWLRYKDGLMRPTELGTFPLADGLPGRVGAVKAYGNAIVPQVAAEFIGAYLDTSETVH